MLVRWHQEVLPFFRIETKMKILFLNAISLVVFAAGIVGLFAWESAATRADKDFYKEISQGHKSMY